MVCSSVATSEGMAAQLIVPEENKIILENGKEFEYDVLAIANGIGEDLTKIDGLKEALEDGDCPVYSSKDFGNTMVIDFIKNNIRAQD